MPLILGSNAPAAGGYEVDNSLRFDDGSSDYLTFTPASNGNRKVFTVSVWVKRANLNSVQNIIGSSDSGFGNGLFIQFQADNTLRVGFQDPNQFKVTNRVFRDVSSWYSIIIAINVSAGSNSDKIKIYVNGVQETSFSTDDTITNADKNWNNTQAHSVGRSGAYNGQYFDGYLAEVVNIDGTQNSVTDFGEFDEDSGIWKPIDVSGLTFGTNGFYLDFENSGSLGADVSGNGNNFTVNNLTSIDQTTDTPTNNFATFNSIVNAAGNNLTLSEGNLKVTSGSSNWNSAIGTIAVNSGKWYWEVKIINTTFNYNHGVFSLDTGDINNTTNPMNQIGYSGFYNFDGGETRIDDTVSTNNYGTFGANDILGFYLNADDNQFTIYKNGSSHVSATNLGTGRTDLVPIAVHNNGGVSEYNFGNSPFTISSGNSDANGYGNFEYSPTIGGVDYYALNSKNLAEYG